MKKYYVIQVWMVAILVLLNTSCKKYLDAKSDAKLVTPQTLQDLQGLLDDANLMNLKTTPGYNESSTDDYFWLPITFNSQPITTQNLYQWIPIDIRYGNDWNQGYLPVYNANLSLELLDKIPQTAANKQQWDNIKGSALFFRAYYFLLLAMQYAKAYDGNTADTDLGIVLRLKSDFNIPSTRASVRGSYQQVITDLTASLDYLPDYPLNLLRPSKGAAYALLARTYLYMHQYDVALTYANKALVLNSYLMNYNSDPFIISLTTAVPFKKFNGETIFYTEMASTLNLNSTTRARIDTVLYGKYNTNDLRKTAFFKANAGYQQYKGSYAANASTFFSGIATDELYLNRAECYAYLNNVNSAMDDLNYLLKKRWKSTVAYTPISATDRTDALTKVRLERRKELLMRGLRWMDIKRLNKEGENIVLTRNINGKIVTLQPNASYYALPIPVDIIEQSGIQQN
ncbi:RagB/SusD family nutrient uptake outer membrane protein [Mucilaginibacter polytrichastri]|uniref:SusD-like N-terminal domain-containing protein n=1 Tax=Mucilaginibacter polytrichastri TaxID=1302689 RepID=A0A1Q5ZVU9_9SPHI|nr:RagB/SusD family nutrient uptake outer membrane protein [Mucilaginibacter polytrichastri]OKS85895.1 hypothetical protein RG47T_1341 [Mucilaginibacter polytrichastri]SFS60737.1 SusD family protein [Mucilaginibacter polytrichastri]